MRRVDVKRVPARRRLVHGGRELAWFVETIDDRGVRRALFDVETGELLDDAWLDDSGRVRSWSATTKDRTDPPVALPRALNGRESIEDGKRAVHPQDRAENGGRRPGPRLARGRGAPAAAALT